MTALSQPAERIVRAAAYVDAQGQLQRDAVIRIRDGRIAGVGGDVPANAAVDAYEGAVVCPGLIDVDAAIGAVGNLSERQSAIQPDATAADAFDRYHTQLREALRAGVTTFALVPDDQNLVGGRIAICRTAGPDGKPAILSGAGPLKLSLSPEVFESDREPTSRSGAVAMLRGALADKNDGPLAALARGETTALITAPSGADVLVALDLMTQGGLRLAIRHDDDARAIAGAVAKAGAAVVVGPYDLSSSPRVAGGAAAFERAGVEVTIAGGLPHRPADSLRTAAAVAARNGLSLDAARRAITVNPARVLGIADRVGSIEEGRDADLVVFSGDPLDLRSRVLAVYVGGQKVFQQAERESDW